MTRLRPLVAVLLSLLLLGAQEAAFAHMIGHIGHVSAAAVTVHGDEGHGEALSLSHVCTTCVSASALFAAAPPGVPPSLTFAGAADTPASTAAAAFDAPAPLAYLARAPPAVL
ncbi:MAG TPA: hypothetical protein VFF82_08870 [Rhodocyclaceae bacterium]|nr:hypothetical protein [Rhodocyclaceae bacterium]